jgi:hypothetical protein
MPTNDFLSPYGAPKYESGSAKAASVATQAALTAMAAGHPARVHGNEVRVDADGSLWYWHSTSTLTADDILVDAADDAPSAGRWIRQVGFVDLACPFTYANADGSTLLTLPTGCRFLLLDSYWEVTTGFTGGSSSAIGVASTTRSTAGDILGGASGDVAATLVAGSAINGTIGATMDTLAEIHANRFAAGEVFTLERITSAFTAGVGKVHLVGILLRNAGA